MDKSIKKILITGSSLLMLASAGVGISQIHVNAATICLVRESDYRQIKHARGIKGTGMPHARIKAFGDNETKGYIHGHKIIISHDGVILSINGHRPTVKEFKALFHKGHHAVRHHHRRDTKRHACHHVRRYGHRSHRRY